MAVIHDTTLTPSKLDLLARWLPEQPWFAAAGDGPSRAGGFRLDDPDGEVGIEFMIVTVGGDVAYLVPMTYRGAPLDGADDALIGTAEHGVLGTRWVYDGEQDLVLQTQLAALLRGEVQAQAQRKSDTPDPTVLVQPAIDAGPVRINRLLSDHGGPPSTRGYVSATWQRRDGTTARGIVAAVG
jgi:hypothetical protein